ncbi:hypothetical protein PsorP6_017923 [Peronosclerospora sorghi]|uniref:Uncharacterized protein n=1 Tax=Peronosclerospora sorghi TaxID=230839 RepID=A0ACC0WEK0_9STRA|nr:hypothetical protein PsorP6_017923 [Peronosclerospora sorghi]
MKTIAEAFGTGSSSSLLSHDPTSAQHGRNFFKSFATLISQTLRLSQNQCSRLNPSTDYPFFVLRRDDILDTLNDQKVSQDAQFLSTKRLKGIVMITSQPLWYFFCFGGIRQHG